MRIDVVTIFPDYLAPLDLSLPGKARRSGLLDLRVHDLRGWTHDRHRTVDDSPYGGGAGMVMRPEPWGEALDELATQTTVLVVPTPSGQRFDQETARELAAQDHLVIACGRYEGIDQRVLDEAAQHMRVREVSLGDYVLNGGEAAALVVTEAVVRLLPGVLGNPASLEEESHEDGLLEYPVYTKPATWRGHAVPEVLMSGDHDRIARWRGDQSRRRTAQRRPDLLSIGDLVELADLIAAGPGAPALGDAAPCGDPAGDADDRPRTRPSVSWALATRADAGELLTLQRACWAGEALEGAETVLRESLDDVVVGLDTGETWALRSGGRLVGAVRGRALDPAGTWLVQRLMVAPDLRGRGIGRWMLARAEERAPGTVTSYEIHVGLTAARTKLLKRAGYRPAGRGEAPTVRMVKPRQT